MHLFSVFSLRNRALIALITVVIGIFGGLALTSFKQELIPSLSLPSVFIVTSYPGASPDVVNTDVSTPIESALQGIENLDSTTATSNTSASTVTAYNSRAVSSFNMPSILPSVSNEFHIPHSGWK